MTARSEAKILIVDDEPTSVESIVVILEHGCSLSTAQSGADALKLLEHETFDLVLLDVDLPDMSGFHVCKQLKSQPSTQQTPVIFLTGYDGMVFEAQAFDAGAVDFITKPASPYRVLMRVNAHLLPQYKISPRQ